MYRLTRKAKRRRVRWALPDEDRLPPAWEPPQLRCVIEITEYDSGKAVAHRFELHKSNRIAPLSRLECGRSTRLAT